MFKLKDIPTSIPALYATENVPPERKIAHTKFFHPGRGTWYACEFDTKDTFFGYVVSPLGPDCDEWGYFSLSELQTLPLMELDLYWQPNVIPELQEHPFSRLADHLTKKPH